MALLVRETKQVIGARGSLVFVKSMPKVSYGEVVELDVEGETRLGQVVDIGREVMVIQVFGSSLGITPGKTVVRLRGETLKIPCLLYTSPSPRD